MTREEWLAARREVVGSSDAAAVCGLSPYKTPLHVYLDKVGELKDEDSGRKSWGRRLEDVVASAYAEETGREVTHPPRMLLRHPTLPWMGASLDRLTRVPGEVLPRVLEIKCVSRGSDDWGEPGTDQVPEAYLIQVQHQLMVTGLEKADLAALFEQSELRVYEIPRNEELLLKLQRILSDFWGFVERREPPPFDWEHPAALEAMRQLYAGVEEGHCLELGEEAGDLVEQYHGMQALTRAHKGLMDGVKARLLALMAGAGAARCPNGYVLTRRVVNRKGYSVDPSSYVDFRVKAPKP